MKSMTGYGLAQLGEEGDLLRVEVASSNHRFFKVSMRLPDACQPYEREIEKIVRDAALRGSVSVSASYQAPRTVSAYTVNGDAVKSYAEQLKKLNRQLELGLEVRWTDLLSLPGTVMVREESGLTARRWKALRSVFKEAVEKMVQMREVEGASLKKEIETHVRRLSAGVDRVEKLAPRVVTRYAARLKKRINLLLEGTDASLSEQEVVKEVALFAERSDITEEVCRLRSHLEQLSGELAKDGEIGRKLDFIAQELLREVNTVGSKANDAQIAKLVVNMKSEIDKIKEQVQNIE